MGSAAGWMWFWFWTVSVCFTALQSDALRVQMRQLSVDVVQSHSVVLPCSFFTSSPLSRLNIIWTLAPFSSPESPVQVIVYDHGQVIEDPSLTGRVAFTGIPWSADIVLNDTRVSDAGVYRCMVNNPPEMADPGVGELLLSILAPPSPPVCHWDGDVDEGGSVTLSCSVTDGVPTPQVHWDKVNPQEISLPFNMEADVSGSVHMVNVSSQTSGLYRCSVSNLLGTETCFVHLSIYNTPDSSSGILQGALVTLSMSLVLAALLVLAMWLHRTGQDGRSERKDEDVLGNTPSLIKRSFV